MKQIIDLSKCKVKALEPMIREAKELADTYGKETAQKFIEPCYPSMTENIKNGMNPKIAANVLCDLVQKLTMLASLTQKPCKKNSPSSKKGQGAVIT